MKAAIAIGCGLLLASCANLPSGGRNTVRFITEPEGALARTSLGQTCTTPCALSISRLDPFTVTFEKDGFEPVTINVASTEPSAPGVRTNVGGVGVRFGVADTGGAVPGDANFQFRRVHQPNPVEARLRPR